MVLTGFRGDGVRGRRLVCSRAHCSSARWRAVVARMLPVRLASSLWVVGETSDGLRGFLPMVAGAASRRDDRGWEKAAGPARPRPRWRLGTAQRTTLSEHLARDESTDGSFLTRPCVRIGGGLVLVLASVF